MTQVFLCDPCAKQCGDRRILVELDFDYKWRCALCCNLQSNKHGWLGKRVPELDPRRWAGTSCPGPCITCGRIVGQPKRCNDCKAVMCRDHLAYVTVGSGRARQLCQRCAATTIERMAT